jgi:hypothetical protein
MTRADDLAVELQTALEAIHAELETLSDDRWYRAVTGPEAWRVGHTAHHIGEGYLLSVRWIDQAVETGQPVVLDPAVDIPAINASNARCLEEHGDESRADTMSFMHATATQLVDRVRRLSDEQLDQPMMVVRGNTRDGSAVALPLSLRHATIHMDSIRGAT